MNTAATPILENTEKLVIGIGWNHTRSDGHDHDLDSSIILVGSDGQCHRPEDLCFYQEGHRTVHAGAVIHYGDEKTGKSEGDDETIDINLALVPADIHKMIVTVSIYQAVARGLNFGLVDGAYVRVSDQSGREIAAYDLSEDASLYTAVEFCEIVRTANGWTCVPVERGSAGGLASVIAKYGFSPK